jgi:CubicO group peptidase (beta-lactamase class C family)
VSARLDWFAAALIALGGCAGSTSDSPGDDDDDRGDGDAAVDETPPGRDSGPPAPDAGPGPGYVDHSDDFPMPDWPQGRPEDYGFDPAGLDEAAAYSASIGGLCLLVIRDGTLVYEKYLGGTTKTSVQKSWSIAKSFTAALTGVAIKRGDLDGVHQSAAELIPEWKGTPKQAITIEHILSMSSGLHYELVEDNTWTVFVADHTAAALANPYDEGPAGTAWHYNNHGVQVMHPILEAATGMDPEQYAEMYLWGPIGMNLSGDKPDRTHWERDGAGNPTMYMSVHSSCRDLARFGYLMLHEGHWDGEVIIDNEYVDKMLSPSQDMNPIYGYFWWLNGYEPAIDSTDEPFEGTMFPGAPDDLFSAQGIGQNFIDVIPSTNTIYVHMRPAPHDPFTNFITDLWGTIDKLFRDGKQIEHRELLQKLLEAS